MMLNKEEFLRLCAFQDNGFRIKYSDQDIYVLYNPYEENPYRIKNAGYRYDHGMDDSYKDNLWKVEKVVLIDWRKNTNFVLEHKEKKYFRTTRYIHLNNNGTFYAMDWPMKLSPDGSWLLDGALRPIYGLEAQEELAWQADRYATNHHHMYGNHVARIDDLDFVEKKDDKQEQDSGYWAEQDED